MKTVTVKIQNDALIDDCQFDIEIGDNDATMLKAAADAGIPLRVSLNYNKRTADITLYTENQVRMYGLPMAGTTEGLSPDIVSCPCKIEVIGDAQVVDANYLADLYDESEYQFKLAEARNAIDRLCDLTTATIVNGGERRRKLLELHSLIAELSALPRKDVIQF